MMNSKDEFFQESPLAGRVKLGTRLIIHERFCSNRELAEITEAGKYGPLADAGIGCKLECGGQIIAEGKLVKKSGKVFFKILQTEKEESYAPR
ncbi:MAG: hypothetical protein HN368_06050 [Spirochaetales bacterium]|jgi:hypothetical protein|nr:hypothetical protein [Spirochaetales bacterium]